MPSAGNNKYTLQDAQDLAATHGGKFLSKEMNKSQDRYEWECAEGHRWKTSFFVVKHGGSWCVKCVRAQPDRIHGPPTKYTLQDVQKVAKDKGGELLSTDYKKTTDQLIWRCAEGHEWATSFSKINMGHWCASCSGLNSERLTRRILEFIYGVPFPKAHPTWLKSPLSDRLLELDCYNVDLCIAAEYNGQQHYNEISYMRKDSLKDLQARDASKIRQCISKGVHLIIIPYTVKHKDLYTFILDKCVKIPINTPTSVPLATFEVTSAKDERFKEISERLKTEAPDVRLISECYLTAQTPMRYECKNGHEFESTWETVVSKLSRHPHSICGKCSSIAYLREKADKVIPKINKRLELLNYDPFSEPHFPGMYVKFSIKCKTCCTGREVTWNLLKNMKKPCCTD